MSENIKEFVNFSALKYATKTRMNPKKGDIVYCKEEDAKFGFNGDKWEKLVPVGDQQLVSMSNYEANQQIISQLPPMNAEEQGKCLNEIEDYFNKTNNIHYMLLCKEFSYYTLFEKASYSEFKNLSIAVLTVLSELGIVRTYHINDNDIELWVTVDGKTHCFHLFAYDLGVVTYG